MIPDRRQRPVEVAQPCPGDAPEASGRQKLVDLPDFASTQFHMIPAATSGMIWGRNSTVRDTVPNRPRAAPRMTDAVTSPSDTGMKLKKTMSLNALKIDVESSSSVKTFGVVVEPDPRGRPDAVPVVERVLEAQDERLEDEHRVEREGRQHEEPAHEMLAANPPEEPGGSPPDAAARTVRRDIG